MLSALRTATMSASFVAAEASSSSEPKASVIALYASRTDEGPSNSSGVTASLTSALSLALASICRPRRACASVRSSSPTSEARTVPRASFPCARRYRHRSASCLAFTYASYLRSRTHRACSLRPRSQAPAKPASAVTRAAPKTVSRIWTVGSRAGAGAAAARPARGRGGEC